MTARSRWGKFGIILYLFIVHLLALFFVLDKINERKERRMTGGAYEAALPDTSKVGHSLSDPAFPAGDSATELGGDEQATPPVFHEISGDTGKLIIPVLGVMRRELQDTYTQSRSGGRVHNAIDIMAPEGTPVVAVADGEIAKFFDSRQGGTTIYQWSVGRKHVYYYAHLQRRAEGISEKSIVRRGTVIGYVGNTGNAGPGNYHLHFAITLPDNPERHWEGTDINPYPLLKEGIEIPALRK